jgi:hypothetical protein
MQGCLVLAILTAYVILRSGDVYVVTTSGSREKTRNKKLDPHVATLLRMTGMWEN